MTCRFRSVWFVISALLLVSCGKTLLQSNLENPFDISLPSMIYAGDTINLFVLAVNNPNVQIEWTTDGGTIVGDGDGSDAVWQTPYDPGRYSVTCIITEGDEIIESYHTTTDIVMPFSREDLICFFPFRDYAKDESSNLLHGQMVGSVMSTDRFGNLNSAAIFDGLNDYIDIGNSLVLKPAFPMTIMAWVRLDQTENQQFFTNNFDNDVYYGIWFSTNYESKLIINYGNGGPTGADSRRTRRGTTSLEQNVWYHVAAVLNDSQNMSVFLNGENDDNDYTGTVTSLQYSSGSGDIGRKDGSFNDPPLFLNGSIDDVIFWGRALTANEIRMIYQYSRRHQLTE